MSAAFPSFEMLLAKNVVSFFIGRSYFVNDWAGFISSYYRMPLLNPGLRVVAKYLNWRLLQRLLKFLAGRDTKLNSLLWVRVVSF